MYDIISRERAGLLDPKKSTPINESYIKGLTVHYTGAAVSPSIKDIDDVFNYLQAIQKDHMDRNKWDDIGYSFAISDVSDEIIELRGFGKYSAHSGRTQINKTFVSVVWLGGVSDYPNANAKKALERLVDIMEERYNRKIMVTGHKDHKPTQCCGTPMYEWIHSDKPKWKQPKKKAVKKWSKVKKKYKIL